MPIRLDVLNTQFLEHKAFGMVPGKFMPIRLHVFSKQFVELKLVVVLRNALKFVPIS